MITEIPKARINITLDLETGGVHQKKELPFKLLILGNFTGHGHHFLPNQPNQSNQPEQSLATQPRLTITHKNLDSVLNNLSPTLNLPEHNISLVFKKLTDFHPDQLVTQMPDLNKLISIRNLLKDLKANLIDNKSFRKALENLITIKNNK